MFCWCCRWFAGEACDEGGVLVQLLCAGGAADILVQLEISSGGAASVLVVQMVKWVKLEWYGMEHIFSGTSSVGTRALVKGVFFDWSPQKC